VNKLTKVGLSALCGSLAAASVANAGTLDVSGGATASWISKSGDVTGNPIGINSGITFKGSGELDNGSTFTLTLTQADQDAWSGGSMVIDTPSFGQFKVASGDGGSGIDSKDDAMPTAWEETDGTGLGTGHDKISGVGGSMNLNYKTPDFGGLTMTIAYAPSNDGVQNADKATSGTTGTKQKAADVLLDFNKSFDSASVNVFTGASISERSKAPKEGGTNTDNNEHHQEGVAGAIITYGPVKVGAQISGEYLGNRQTGSDTFGYRNVAYGVSFNITDDLSISYGFHESKRGFVSNDTHTVISEAESLQVAYSIGGASIKIASTEVEDQNYVTGTTGDKEATTVAVSLAF